jgi:hypothetical protein
MVIERTTYNGLQGFIDTGSRALVLHRELHGHVLVYTPGSHFGMYAESIIPVDELYGIFDEGTTIDEVEARCKEVLETKSKAEPAEATQNEHGLACGACVSARERP